MEKISQKKCSTWNNSTKIKERRDEMAKKGGLGMGLDALFTDNSNEIQVKQTLRTNEIEPNREQPRRDFNEESISTLADSIKEHGLLQPIVVRPLENGVYQIVAGERRWRACRMIGLSEVPVIIKDLSDFETAQLALIENLQREDLNPLEEAMGYNDLMEKYNMTQEAVSKILGKSRSTVANLLRILSLPDEIKEMLRDGKISVGHAKALMSLDEGILLETAKKASEGLLTVRDIEKLANKNEKEKPAKSRDSYYKEMEIGLKNELQRKVKVSYSGNKGTLTLEFYDKDDLSELAKKLTDTVN